MLPLLLLTVGIDLEGLATNPGVAKVERVIPGEKLIVHIRNWHIVPKDEYGKSERLKGEALETAYAKLVKEAASVQRSNLLILDGQREVFVEGITVRDVPIVAAELRTLKEFHRELKQFDPENGEDTRQILAEHRLTLLRLGAAGEMILEGKGIEMLPAESEPEFRQARPKNGEIDHEAQAARETAIVNRMISHGQTSLLILGGAHDLAPAVRKHKGWGYVRVTPKGFPE